MENTKDEIWKDVPNYEGIYRVSNLGRVMRIWKYKAAFIKKHGITEKTYILSPIFSGGYNGVGLYKDKKYKHFSIHRIVAMAFLGFDPSVPDSFINHIDVDRFNNCVDNLEIVTARENQHRKTNNVYEGFEPCIYIEKGLFLLKLEYLGESYYLGRYSCKDNAIKVRNIALERIDDGSFVGWFESNSTPATSPCSSRYTVRMSENCWRVAIRNKKVGRVVEYHKTENDASEAVDRLLAELGVLSKKPKKPIFNKLNLE